MKLGFIIPHYSCEKRVALLPADIGNFPDEIWMEHGFGQLMDIPDEEYSQRGCYITDRKNIFQECDTIFSLKLLQPDDYDLLRPGQMIIGWTHPTGSGTDFMKEQAIPKHLIILDLDTTFPRMYKNGKFIDLKCFSKNFICQNSFKAGSAAVLHAFLTYGTMPNGNMRIAVLGSGNTAQGAFHMLSRFTDSIRMYYRKTMSEFLSSISDFDVIVNGIEVDGTTEHIVSEEDLKRTKPHCLIIDAAADAGNAIATTKYTNIANPIYERDNRYFYCVNNTPSLIFRDSSIYLSQVFSKEILKDGVERFWQMANTF